MSFEIGPPVDGSAVVSDFALSVFAALSAFAIVPDFPESAAG
jgi:hypothetical protein